MAEEHEEHEEHGQVREEAEPLDPEREARRRLALAQIRQYPDPVLRMKAREVEDFDDDLRRLVERMTQLMQDANGVGLAGTQVGTLQRVFVFQPTAEDEPRALVNPTIVDSSEEQPSDTEGCLSLQGVSIPVERPVSVTIEAKDETGADVRLELEEHAARVAQHELDHLDGILIIDRTTPEARREAMGLLRPLPLLGATP
jgi:peptide deformylase